MKIIFGILKVTEDFGTGKDSKTRIRTKMLRIRNTGTAQTNITPTCSLYQYRHYKRNEPTKEGLLSFVRYSLSPHLLQFQ